MSSLYQGGAGIKFGLGGAVALGAAGEVACRAALISLIGMLTEKVYAPRSPFAFVL
jgi:hypothetical protein